MDEKEKNIRAAGEAGFYLSFTEEERQAAWWLSGTPGFSARKLGQATRLLGSPAQILSEAERLERGAGNPDAWWEKARENREKEGEPERIVLTPQDFSRLILHSREKEACFHDYDAWMGRGIRFILAGEAAYPGRLLFLCDRPFALYVRGNLPEEGRPAAAIVGARNCTAYGSGEARHFACDLAGLGIRIGSGLARGVDASAHRGALLSGVRGATFAVLGCGPERTFPPSHRELAEEILSSGGGLISEYPPGSSPEKQHFRERTRILAGLADCVLVMEAGKNGPSLLTVDMALEQGKEVFALPGRVGDPLSAGCHRLIRDGAALLTDPEEVADFLLPGRRRRAKRVAEGGQDACFSENPACAFKKYGV